MRHALLDAHPCATLLAALRTAVAPLAFPPIARACLALTLRRPPVRSSHAAVSHAMRLHNIDRARHTEAAWAGVLQRFLPPAPRGDALA